MKKVSRRAMVLYAVVAAFLIGVGILFFTFFTNADAWSMKKANRHLYTSGALTTAGTIYDANGTVLAETKDGARRYNKNKTVRLATLHVLGDAEGFIATGVHTSYKDELTGYSFIDGIYDLKRYGKGSDMTLTLNADLCAAAYKALAGQKGTVGVYNYKTGEILCTVSAPTYDIQNKPSEEIAGDKTGKYEGVYLNRFVSGLYTPGSTFKIITAACAIENMPDIYTRKFTCTGEYKVGGGSVKCNGVHGKETFEQALNHSCNSVFSELAVELGAEKLTATAKALGFNEAGTLGKIRLSKSTFDVSSADALSLGWSGVGQYTTLLNPCHMLTIVGAIAAGGASPEPYLVSKTTSPAGHTTFEAKTKLQTPYFSESTAEQLKALLRSNVKNQYGDGKFPKMQMCGKTGTAEVSSSDAGAKPHAWFVGFSEREDFPLAIVVVVENGGSGAGVAIPVAQKVMQAALAALR